MEKQDQIALVTARFLNALNSAVITELEQVVADLEAAVDRAMILTGQGRSFVAGADIGEQYPLDLSSGRSWGRRLTAAPWKAGISYHCRGKRLRPGRRLRAGNELRYYFSIRKAKFGQPEVGLGITPRLFRHQRLPRRGGHCQGQG